MAVLQDFEQQYEAGGATGAAVNEKLASLLGKMLRQQMAEEKVTAKLKVLSDPLMSRL